MLFNYYCGFFTPLLGGTIFHKIVIVTIKMYLPDRYVVHSPGHLIGLLELFYTQTACYQTDTVFLLSDKHDETL